MLSHVSLHNDDDVAKLETTLEIETPPIREVIEQLTVLANKYGYESEIDFGGEINLSIDTRKSEIKTKNKPVLPPISKKEHNETTT